MAANLLQEYTKEFTKAFDSNIDVILLSKNIIHVPNVDALVNCTGKYFEHKGIKTNKLRIFTVGI
jgi:hypothetical protein